MSTKETQKQNQQKETNYETPQDNLENEELDEEPVYDQETQERLRNLTIDGSAFANETVNKNKKRNNKQKQQKANKKKKGEDFLEYAEKHGIDVKLEYEEKSHNNEFKEEKKYYKSDNQQNSSKPVKRQNFNKPENQPKVNPKKQTQSSSGVNKMGFNNKFDPMNSHYQHPYFYNPMQQMGGMGGMRPDMMFYGQMPMTNPMMMPIPPQMMMEPDTQPPIRGGILESLEYYLSLENLNKDTYTRSKMDDDGYIEANEILKFNNMKKNGADLEKINELIESNDTQVEKLVRNGKVFFRNKNWNSIENKLLPIEEIEANRKQKKGQYNMNYYNLQNNFFYTGPMMPMDYNMMYPQMQQMGHPNMMNPYNMMNENMDDMHN